MPLEQTLKEVRDLLGNAHKGFDYAIVHGLIMSIVDRHDNVVKENERLKTAIKKAYKHCEYSGEGHNELGAYLKTFLRE